MSAEKKPEKTAEVPPFLQTKPGQPMSPKPSPTVEAPPEIPYFLRAGASGLPPEKQPAAPKPAAPPPTTKQDPGLLFSLNTQRQQTPPPASPPPPEPKSAPAFLRPEAQLPEAEMHMPSPVLSAEEVQHKLDAMARANEKDQAAAPAVPPPSNEPPRQRPPTKTINWESAPEIFEQMVEGIRRDRVSHERDMLDLTTKIEHDWQHVLESMRELQRKVEGHPNLIYFTISRDQQDISVKVIDHSNKRGYSLFTLSRRHPGGAHPSLNAVWLVEFPAREWHYYDAKEAMAELVARIAGSLA
jgi:hypothetical protein